MSEHTPNQDSASRRDAEAQRLRIGDVVMVGGVEAVVYTKRWHPLARRVEAIAMMARPGEPCTVALTARGGTHVVDRGALDRAAMSWGCLEHYALKSVKAARTDRNRVLWRKLAATYSERRSRLWRLFRAGEVAP